MNRRFFVTRSLVRRIFLPYWVPQVMHEDRIPASGPLLVVANHPTILDAIFLTAALRRPVSFVISQEVAALPLVGGWFRAMGSAVAGESAYSTCLQALRQNQAVGLMPEGGPTHREELGPFRSGVARLARESGAAVVPVALVGPKPLMEERCRYLGGGPVQVRVGHPLLCDAQEEPEEFLGRLHRNLSHQLKRAQACPPWRPDWRFHCARALWVPLTAALFACLEWVKPGHRR